MTEPDAGTGRAQVTARTHRTPRQRIAPGTHPREQDRLARQEAAHPDSDLLNVQTLIWLFRAYNAAMNAQARELRAIGLSPSAFNVLMALVNTPGNTIEPYDLAERLLISRPSITGLLDTLQRKELIRRDPHPEDRRRVLVTLTDAARVLLQEHYPVHYANQQNQLGDLSADEKAQLVTLLRRVKGATPKQLSAEPDAGAAPADHPVTPADRPEPPADRPEPEQP